MPTAIVSPGQFMLALELRVMDAASMANRFGQKLLSDVQQAVPLDPTTVELVQRALALLEGA